ncbi:uncharacterized protein LOC111089719 [Limulus polyphemus]|uniref:Uncharacterized protein LOC111089719 n=1 Tax=Limulus polyphemus TaxID=6850 RepID=A0ABM1TRA0_LIMPO|nr:uncharacterized protein LOC111089719 [Limulus polyphemus]
MFSVLLWAIMWTADGRPSESSQQEQKLNMSRKKVEGNLTSLECENVSKVLQSNAEWATEGTFHINLSHPFLDINQGLVPGVVYDVWLMTLKNVERPLLVTSYPRGNFTAYPSSAVLCVQTEEPLTSTVLLTPKPELFLKWLIPTGTVEDTLVLKAFHQDSDGQWTFAQIKQSRRIDCFYRIPVQKQILTSDDLRSRSDNCSEIKVFVDRYPSTRNYLKLLDLNALTTKNWLFLTVDNEKSPGYAVTAIKRQEREPSFIAVGRFFLLTVHKCKTCQFKAVFSSLDQEHGCNITVDAVEGILTSPNFPEKYPPGLDCYYNIEATVGLRIVISVTNLDMYSRNTEGICNENYVRVFPLKEQREVFLCGKSVGSREYLVSKRETLTVHLHVSRGKGFLFKYRSIKPCENITIEQENGSLCSEDYPYSFMTEQSCLYAFYVPLGYKLHVQLTFLETSLSSVTSRSDCVEEFIEISSEEQVVRLCGITSENTNQGFSFQSNSYTNITVNLNAVPTLINGAKGFCIDFQTVSINPLGTFCGYPWSENEDYCYQLVHQNLNWWSANGHCLSQGGHLATTSSNDIQSFLELLIKASSLYGHTHAFWIGANDIEHENYYDWADGHLFGFSIHVETSKRIDCNRTIFLQASHPRDVIASPGYPEPYTKLLECYYNIRAPSGERINLDFTDFILEEHESCAFDYVEVQDGDETGEVMEYCGDYTSKLKHLRHLSTTNEIKLKFVSDFSHAYRGFRAKVHLWNDNVSSAEQCDSEIFHLFNNQCYFVASYPKVTWVTARQICVESGAKLASFSSTEEKLFVNSLILSTEAFSSGVLYWIGGTKEEGTRNWNWVDEQQVGQSELTKNNEIIQTKSTECLAIQWRTLDNISDLYWTLSKCDQPGRYICKKKAVVIPRNLDQSFSGDYGIVSSINFPGHYINNLHYTITLKGRPLTRIYIKFTHLDVEWQDQCMYDYISIRSDPNEPETRFCGQHQHDLDKFIFVSDNSTAYLTFHSDYSITSTGFQTTWEAIDVSVCQEVQHTSLTVKISYISHHYPKGYLPNTFCKTQFQAPPGKKILLTFTDFDVGFSKGNNPCRRDYLEIQLESGHLRRSVVLCGNASSVAPGYQFISYDETVTLELSTSSRGGRGFNVSLEIWNGHQLNTVLRLSSLSEGILSSLNYPHNPPKDLNYTQQLVSPLGTYISLYFFRSSWAEGRCVDNILTVEDFYSEDKPIRTICIESYRVNKTPDLQIDSVFNSIHLGIWMNSENRILKPYLIRYRVLPDPLFINKSLGMGSSRLLDGCFCKNGGTCVTSLEGLFKCQCKRPFMGLFCHLHWCHLNPCGIHGTCVAAEDSYMCDCTRGFTGDHCDQLVTPCNPSPCGLNGHCLVVNNTFHCRCHVWYEGPRCTQFVFRIPYKPLSERMLEEPFWLGLITVSTVLLIILLVYCIKQKFAEKIEKFFAEEIEKSKNSPSPAATRYSLSSNQASITPATLSPQPCPKYFLNKIRKHSIHSTSSCNHSPSHKENGRTFGFDDLLKRSFSSRKHQQNSRLRDSDKNEEETSRILASLVHSNQSPKHRRMSLDEFIKMNRKKFILNAANEESQGYMSDMSLKSKSIAETSFMESLSPRFSRYSAPSFTEFHSIREQSFEQASSLDSFGYDIKMDETKVEISPLTLQTFDQSGSESIEEKPTRDTSCTTAMLQTECPSKTQSPINDTNLFEVKTITNDEIPYQTNQASDNLAYSYNTTISSKNPLEVSNSKQNCPSSPPDDVKRKLCDVPEVNHLILTKQCNKGSPKPKDPEFSTSRKYSAELPPPKILITSNMSSCDSEETSPPRTPNTKNSLMNYLSPLTAICPSSDRTTSESNLSTSGYSSLSSLGMSRCNSSSPLAEEQEVGGKKLYLPQKAAHLLSPRCRSSKCESKFLYPPQQIYSYAETTPELETTCFPQRRASVGGTWFPATKDIGHFLNKKLGKRYSYQHTSTEDSVDDEGIVSDAVDFKTNKATHAKEFERSLMVSEKYQKPKRDMSPSKQYRKLACQSLQLPETSISYSGEMLHVCLSSSPKLRKNNKSKTYIDPALSNTCSSTGVETDNERILEYHEGKIMRNSSKPSLGSRVISSSDDDLDSLGPRHKSPRRPHKKHDTQFSPTLRRHKMFNSTSTWSKSPISDTSHGYREKPSGQYHRTALSSPAVFDISTSEDNLSKGYSTNKEKLGQKLCLSSKVLPTTDQVREKLHDSPKELIDERSVSSELLGLASSTKRRARKQCLALHRQRSHSDYNMRKIGLTSLDSIESSAPSDNDDDHLSTNVTQPMLRVPVDINHCIRPILRRQEALIENDGSDDSSCETTVLLKQPARFIAVPTKTVRSVLTSTDPELESSQISPIPGVNYSTDSREDGLDCFHS